MDPVYLFSEQRRGAVQALKIATAKKNERAALRSVIVDHGYAFVCDMHVAVSMPSLAGLPHGGWSADALELAFKGAGKDGVRISQVDQDTLRVDRFAPKIYGEQAVRDLCEEEVPAQILVGTFFVGRVDGVPDVSSMYDKALEAALSTDYEPEVASFNPDLLSSVFAARPNAFDRVTLGSIKLMPRGMSPAVVAAGDVPYAIVMPMRS